MPDQDDRYGRIFHERGRLTVNAERGHDRRGIGPWEERDPEQQEIDMRGASAVAAQVLADNDLAPLLRQLAWYRQRHRTLRDLCTDKPDRVTAGDVLRILGDEEGSDAER